MFRPSIAGASGPFNQSDNADAEQLNRCMNDARVISVALESALGTGYLYYFGKAFRISRSTWLAI